MPFALPDLHLLRLALHLTFRSVEDSARLIHLIIYRTLTPDLLVNILAAIFIDANSWKSSFVA
jgi:hypothetical protein